MFWNESFPAKLSGIFFANFAIIFLAFLRYKMGFWNLTTWILWVLVFLFGIFVVRRLIKNARLRKQRWGLAKRFGSVTEIFSKIASDFVDESIKRRHSPNPVCSKRLEGI